MRLAELVVVDIMGRCHLQASRTEFDIHISVLDNGNDTTDQRHDDFMPTQPLVLRVFRIDAHCCITHNCLGASCSHNSVVALGVMVDDIAFCINVLNVTKVLHIVFQIIQFALLVAVDDFLGGEHGLCLRVPVDHA